MVLQEDLLLELQDPKKIPRALHDILISNERQTEKLLKLEESNQKTIENFLHVLRALPVDLHDVSQDRLSAFAFGQRLAKFLRESKEGIRHLEGAVGKCMRKEEIPSLVKEIDQKINVKSEQLHTAVVKQAVVHEDLKKLIFDRVEEMEKQLLDSSLHSTLNRLNRIEVALDSFGINLRWKSEADSTLSGMKEAMKRFDLARNSIDSMITSLQKRVKEVLKDIMSKDKDIVDNRLSFEKLIETEKIELRNIVHDFSAKLEERMKETEKRIKDEEARVIQGFETRMRKHELKITKEIEKVEQSQKTHELKMQALLGEQRKQQKEFEEKLTRRFNALIGKIDLKLEEMATAKSVSAINAAIEQLFVDVEKLATRNELKAIENNQVNAIQAINRRTQEKVESMQTHLVDYVSTREFEKRNNTQDIKERNMMQKLKLTDERLNSLHQCSDNMRDALRLFQEQSSAFAKILKKLETLQDANLWTEREIERKASEEALSLATQEYANMFHFLEGQVDGVKTDGTSTATMLREQVSRLAGAVERMHKELYSLQIGGVIGHNTTKREERSKAMLVADDIRILSKAHSTGKLGAGRIFRYPQPPDRQPPSQARVSGVLTRSAQGISNERKTSGYLTQHNKGKKLKRSPTKTPRSEQNGTRPPSPWILDHHVASSPSSGSDLIRIHTSLQAVQRSLSARTTSDESRPPRFGRDGMTLQDEVDSHLSTSNALPESEDDAGIETSHSSDINSQHLPHVNAAEYKTRSNTSMSRCSETTVENNNIGGQIHSTEEEATEESRQQQNSRASGAGVLLKRLRQSTLGSTTEREGSSSSLDVNPWQ